MNVWKRLLTVLKAFNALYWVLLLIYLGFNATVVELISGPFEQGATLQVVFLTTAPITLAFAAIMFVCVEGARMEADARVVFGVSIVVLFVAVILGTTLGYPEVDLPKSYVQSLYNNPGIHFLLFAILLFPLVLMYGVMDAYGIKALLASLVFGVVLGMALLYLLGRLSSQR